MKCHNPPIYLLPWAGLANRMRGIDSCLTLSHRNNRQLRVFWIREPFCNIRFHDLFMPVESEWIYIRDANALDDLRYNIAKNRNFRIPALYQRIRFGNRHRLRPQECQIYADRGEVPDVFEEIDSAAYLGCGAQLVPPENYDSIFRPQSVLLNIAESAFGNRDPARCVGMHIRRSDHIPAITRSPTSLFVNEAERILSSGMYDSIFLATDDESVKREFNSRFPQNAWTRYIELSRSTVGGMRDAFVDMLILSKCGKVFGCHASTFAETAAWMGRKPYATLELSS